MRTEVIYKVQIGQYEHISAASPEGVEVTAEDVHVLVDPLQQPVLVDSLVVFLIEPVGGSGPHVLGLEGGGQLALLQLPPWVLDKPGMLLEILDPTLVAESAGRLSDNELVDEVCRLNGPVGRDVLLLDRVLLGQDCLPDFVPVLAVIGPAPHHHLVADDADRVEVHRVGVHLLVEHLGGHVARSPAGVKHLPLSEAPGDPKIGQPEVTLGVQHQVFGLDVAVEDCVGVDLLDGLDEAGDEELGLLLGQPLIVGQQCAQVPAGQEIHTQVQVVSVVESKGHVGDKRTLYFGKNFHLIQDVIDALLHDDEGFRHLLHGEDGPGLVVLHLPDLAIAALSHHSQKIEVRSGQLVVLEGTVHSGVGDGYIEVGVLFGLVDLDDVGQRSLNFLLDLAQGRVVRFAGSPRHRHLAEAVLRNLLKVSVVELGDAGLW